VTPMTKYVFVCKIVINDMLP